MRSRHVSDDEETSRGLLQLRDPNSVPPKKLFHSRRPIIAVFKPDNFWTRISILGKAEKV